jgi:hypothetical protein
MFIVYVGPCSPLMTEEDLLCTGDRSIRFTFGTVASVNNKWTMGKTVALVKLPVLGKTLQYGARQTFQIIK